MLRKKNIDAAASAFLYGMIFLILLACNIWTPYLVDDYQYAFSFATGERLTCISDILPSLIAHAEKINGRLVAHAIVHVFALLPNGIFDIVNAGVFVFQIALIIKLCGIRKNKCMAILCVFCGIWMVELDFGQVNLWQDGAVNYLWSIVAACLYLIPYARLYSTGKSPEGTGRKTLFAIIAFLAGAYSETVSAASIFMAVLLVLLHFWESKKLDKFMLAAVFVSFLGYISIYLAPGQWMNKSVEPSLGSLLSSALKAVYRYEEIGILLIPYAVLLILNLSENRDPKRVRISIVFILGSLAANFIMVVAGYYPGRSAVGACLFLAAANLVLIPPLLETERFKLLIICSVAVLSLITAPQVIRGCRDVAVCNINMKRSEQVILESKEQGIMDVAVPMVYGYSKYSALANLEYLSQESTETWPNGTVAEYYGVHSVIGIDTR